MSLRNERKPCHFWVDNEVADCYQPIVGADAIWVYCRIARCAHGAWIMSPKVRGGDTRVSLREMADWCGKSVDTVWRCLQVLQHVGLIQAQQSAKSKGRYALADVKDLVMSEGGVYDREAGSFQLPVARAAELRSQVKDLRVKLARKTSGLEVVGAKLGAAASVAQSDRLAGSLFSGPDEKCDRSVAQSDKTVAPGATDLFITRKQESKTERPPKSPLLPTPSGKERPTGTPDRNRDLGPERSEHAGKTKDGATSVATEDADYPEGQTGSGGADTGGGSRGERRDSVTLNCEVRVSDGGSSGSQSSIDLALETVMLGIGATARRLRRRLRGVMAQRVEQGYEAEVTAAAMVDAWDRQKRQGARLFKHLRAAPFFEEGYWLDSNTWDWDNTQIREDKLRAEARVGSNW